MANRQATIHSGIHLHRLSGLGLVLMLCLVACSQTPVAHPVTSVPLLAASSTTLMHPTAPFTPELSKTIPVSTASPDLTPTPDCNTQPGQVEELELDTTYMYQPLRFRIYLPACYSQDNETDYPVLYLFHGLFYSDDQWTRIGAVEVVNRLIISGEIAPFIMVMPYDPNQREPGSTSFDEVFMEDLLPYIEANFRTLNKPDYRAVGGLSRGAGWALHFGLKDPGLFGAIGAHSPIIFWEDSTEIEKWMDSISRNNMPRFYVDIGENDPNPESAILLENYLQERNIPFEYNTSPGYHTEQYWASQLESYIRWYAAGW